MKAFYNSNKPAAEIFDILADVRKFSAAHPVITRIDRSGNDYIVHETLKIGSMPVSFTYPMIMECRPLEGQVIMIASVAKTVQIRIVFIVRSIGGKTVIEEEINFKPVFPIRLIMGPLFQRQHEKLFRNIELTDYSKTLAPIE